MTRFARSKGSKASNERLPENSTSWFEIKHQLAQKNKEIEDNKHKKNADLVRSENYKTFLKQKEDEELKQTKWADFPGVQKPEIQIKNKKTVSKALNSKSKSLKTKTTDSGNSSSDDEQFLILKAELDKVLENIDDDNETALNETKIEKNQPVKKTKKSKLLNVVVKREEKIGNDKQTKPVKNKKKADNIDEIKQKPKKIKIEEKADDSAVKTIEKIPVMEENLTEKELLIIEKKKQRRQRQKEKRQKLRENKQKQDKESTLSPEQLQKIEKKKEKRLKQLEKKKQHKLEQKLKEESNKNADEKVSIDKKISSEINGIENNSVNNLNSVNGNKSFNKEPTFPQRPVKQIMQPSKKAKVKDNDKPPRKKPQQPSKMFINGKEMEIDYVDGFPVKKEDAERLKQLRREMISKGLPRSEINVALKLERRKAEKAFSRERKKVCFHCRKSGHNLSECPDLDKNELAQSQGSGICFKCGSTEHTHFECKVVRGQEFNYAQCFICNEQGHIARQCPDNARGLYPKGGACKVCGDVTHLKKDCPKYQAQQQKEENTFRVETIDGSNPDVLEENKSSFIGVKTSGKQLNKIIKF